MWRWRTESARPYTQPSLSQQSHKRQRRNSCGSQGRSVAYRFDDNVARSHVKPRGKRPRLHLPRVPSQGPGCRIRQRFSAMLADCGFETCENHWECGAGSGIFWRADRNAIPC
jgi:hypothetical protein